MGPIVCSAVFELLIKTKYLCENIVCLLKPYLYGCNRVFIWNTEPYFLSHWKWRLLATSEDVTNLFFTKMVTHSTASWNLVCELWWYLFQMSPMYILCPMFNLFLIKYKGVFQETYLLSQLLRFSDSYFNIKGVPNDYRYIFKIQIIDGVTTLGTYFSQKYIVNFLKPLPISLMRTPCFILFDHCYSLNYFLQIQKVYVGFYLGLTWIKYHKYSAIYTSLNWVLLPFLIGWQYFAKLSLSLNDQYSSTWRSIEWHPINNKQSSTSWHSSPSSSSNFSSLLIAALAIGFPSTSSSKRGLDTFFAERWEVRLQKTIQPEHKKHHFFWLFPRTLQPVHMAGWV